MTNPRPSYNYLLIEASTAAAFSPATCASIGFQTFEKLPGNRIRLHTCTGGPAALIDKWRSGKRDYLVVEFRNGQPVARYHIDQAWPVKWIGASLKASGSEVAMESIELVHEGLH